MDDEDVVVDAWLATVTAAAVGVELVGVGLPLDAVASAPADVLSFLLDSCRVLSRVVTGDEAREEPPAVFPFEEPAPPRRIIRSASSSLSIPWRMGRITVRPEKKVRFSIGNILGRYV